MRLNGVFSGSVRWSSLGRCFFSSEPTVSRIDQLYADFIVTAKEIVKDNLSDPASATFDEVRNCPRPRDPYAARRGLVNAKNKFGGYVGRTPSL